MPFLSANFNKYEYFEKLGTPLYFVEEDKPELETVKHCNMPPVVNVSGPYVNPMQYVRLSSKNKLSKLLTLEAEIG